MRSVRNPFVLVTLLFLAFGLSACPSSTDGGDPAVADAEAFAALQAAKADLDAKRQELRDLRGQVAGGGEEEGSEEDGSEQEAGEDGGGGDGAEGREDRLAALEAEVAAMTEAFTNQVIEYINSQDLYEGQELTENQRAAFDIKAREDILVAREYIEKAGNYQKAIDIYTTSLIADPDSEILAQARAEAEELRYMAEDRFAAAKKGMTEAEVREALGTPQPRNVREYENGVTAWFYPREGRKAAAVYFKQERGELKVYSADFNAVEREEEGEGEGEEEEG
jgi:hypothetical protein